jgi:dephospho-CoA kinase
MSPVRIPVIGIVGGIGSGKTALAEAIAQRIRCCRLDADRSGHQALTRPDILMQLRSTFGDQIFDSQGKILRAALAQRVFGTAPEQIAARRDLERIVHPSIRHDLQRQLEEHQQAQDCDLILLDAALLFEADWGPFCDAVLFVETSEDERLNRVRSRGWSQEDLTRREASQMPLEEKRRRSSVLIENSANLESAAQFAVDWLTAKFPRIRARQHTCVPS